MFKSVECREYPYDWQADKTMIQVNSRKNTCLNPVAHETHRPDMGWKRRLGGGVIAFIGFMLSPLSWWNDIFINVPLAVGFGWVISLAHPPAFEIAVIIGYWLTNIIGLVLMQKGAQQAVSDKPAQPYTRRELLKDLGISLLYTGLIVILVKLKVLQPIADYFPKN